MKLWFAIQCHNSHTTQTNLIIKQIIEIGATGSYVRSEFVEKNDAFLIKKIISFIKFEKILNKNPS